MLQPFEPFTPSLILRLKKLDRPFLVSQSYPRAMTRSEKAADQKMALLFSDYPARGPARLHFEAIRADRYAAVIDLQNEKHQRTLEQMLEPISNYQLFFAMLRSAKALENQVNGFYKDRLRQYVDRHTTWRLPRDAAVKPSVELVFGELFLVIQHAGQTLRIRFMDIEE